MKNKLLAKPSPKSLLLTTVITLVVGGVIFSIFEIFFLSSQLKDAKGSLASSTVAMSDLNAKYAEVLGENTSLNGVLSDTQKAKLDLERAQTKDEKKIDTLTKLTTIDPELLKKYSKIYFLNENYVPPSLSDIDTQYLANPLHPLKILTQVQPFLDDMLQAASDDDIPLRVVSAYRSFQDQKSLKSTYVVTYGAGTSNQFSADQGYSEHQMGTALDFGTPAYPGATDGFKTTTAYQWLLDNAYRFGFILSYPAGNAYYKYEPWHWRFVGRTLASDLQDENKYFYDLDQRELDKYLIKIFD